MSAESVLTFRDREDGARQLLLHLEDLKGQNPLVLGVPRGAIPMAKIIAEELHGDLDLILVKKVGHPLQPEFALGAVTEDGEIVLGMGAIENGITKEQIEESAKQPVELLRMQRAKLTHRRAPISPKDRVVVVVDDGIATGATMSAAVQSLKSKGAKRVIVAAPVTSREAKDLLELSGAEVRAVAIPKHFGAVSYYYQNFTQISEAEISSFFKLSAAQIKVSSLNLDGILGIPKDAQGVVIFAHGSGSSRLSPRNQFVAEMLNKHHIATLLVDLLTEVEGQNRQNVFDIRLLAYRLTEITDWLIAQPQLRALKVGYFGASTGAGAALSAAAHRPTRISAIVSRGGRPDLAGADLEIVKAPTLMIVGGRDIPVLALNQKAYQRMHCERKIEIVERATHLFEEPGTIERVSELAIAWFQKYFGEAVHPATAISMT